MTAEIKSCPMCGTDAPASATTCDCGYAFKTGGAVAHAADATPTVHGDGWTMAGWALTVLGGLGMVVCLFLDITVDAGFSSEGVVNLGLMFRKGFVAACSLSALGLGVFCLGIGAVVKAIRRG